MVVVAVEALAGAQTVHAWLPMLEIWQIGLGLMAILTAVNLASARSYGEFEFWFASIKVVAIVAFIVIAGGLAVGRQEFGEPRASQTSPRTRCAPFGWTAILGGITTVIFSMVAPRS